MGSFGFHSFFPISLPLSYRLPTAPSFSGHPPRKKKKRVDTSTQRNTNPHALADLQSSLHACVWYASGHTTAVRRLQVSQTNLAYLFDAGLTDIFFDGKDRKALPSQTYRPFYPQHRHHTHAWTPALYPGQTNPIPCLRTLTQYSRHTQTNTYGDRERESHTSIYTWISTYVQADFSFHPARFFVSWFFPYPS